MTWSLFGLVGQCLLQQVDFSVEIATGWRRMTDITDDLNSWSSGSSAIWRIIPYQCTGSAWQSLLLHKSQSSTSYTTLWTCQWWVVRWYVYNVLVPCMHSDGVFCPGSRLGKQSVTCTKSLPNLYQVSTHHVLRSPPTSVEERPGERRKTPYSLDINLITTRLSIGSTDVWWTGSPEARCD